MKNNNKDNNNSITLQFTLYCTTGQYKPVSCLLTLDSVQSYNQNPSEFQKRAIEKICMKRYWSRADLCKYGYTKIKCRIYEKNLDK